MKKKRVYISGQLKFYRITARAKVPCEMTDEDAFIVEFKALLKKYGVESVHINIFKNDNP